MRDDGVHVRWLALDELRFDPVEMLPVLSPVERARFAATANPQLAERFVVGRVLARILAAELTGLTASAITVSAVCAECGGPHGRPLLCGPNGAIDGLSLSIAHCAAAVVAAVSWDGVVGVDVEPVAGSADRAGAIVEVAGVPFGDSRRPADPLQHWTRIEAALKADGRGLTVDPRRVRIHERDGRAQARIDAPEGERRFRLAEPKLHPSLQVSIALGSDATSGVTLGWRREHDLSAAIGG
ncbi:4-phosphopantetheinyl transferase [Microbacteriaceae bacterium VKM Ac-2854]|nr:4-phosphopantetheinyl transferase [Microbacteriaceae bacterium VKM Ac-2854]